MPVDNEFMLQTKANNTFTLQALEKTLNEIKHNSFKYLYNLQLEFTSYKRFDMKMSDLTLTNIINNKLNYYPRKYVGYVNENFIIEKKRKEFKRSQFFNRELNLFEVSNNPNVFHYTYLVFINGKLFDTINILCKENTTYFIFDIAEGMNPTGIPKSYFDELLAIDADITIYFVPNCAYGAYTTNINVLNKYKDGLALSRFNLAGSLDSDANYITFVNNNDFLFSSVITDTTQSSDLLRFTDNTLNSFDSKLIHINIFGFRYLLDQFDIVGTEKYFTIPIQDMPVPAENVMIFKNIDGKKYFAHNVSLKLYYPNIYEIIGNDSNDDLTIYVFYSQDSLEVTTLEYKNELSLYYNFATNILDKYKDNSIPDIIKNFEPYEYKYDINEFKNSLDFPDHFKYKVNTLHEWARNNSEVLRAYLYNQIKSFKGYYIDVSKLDLTSKYRENNFNEVFNIEQQEIFDEPRYVFVFKNEFKDDYMHLRFFIDGKLYIPDKQAKDTKFEYYYIPTTLVNSDSIIEVEKFLQYQYSENLWFPTMETVLDVELPDGEIEVSINDLFFTNNNDYYRYIPRDKFIITSINEDGETLTYEPDSFNTIKKFKVQINDPFYTNCQITLFVKKRSYVHQYNITNNTEIINPFVFDLDSINDERHFRIFRNGYHIPFSIYNIDFDAHMIDKFFVGMNMPSSIGDTIVADCTPYKFKEIYYQKNISTNGFVDLTGIVDEPIDLKWYDIFLNGLKLTKKNIDIITSTKMFIKNVNTTKNLVIVKKERDTEVFRLQSGYYDIGNDIWESLTEIRDAAHTAHPDIIDTMDDILNEIIENIGPDLLRFYEYFAKYQYINPDLDHDIDEDWIAEFPSIFTSPNNVLLLNPDDGADAQIYMEVTPKI